MEKSKRVSALTIVLTAAIIGIVLWKYSGVAKKGEVVVPENNKTAEEKLLKKVIAKVGNIEDGQIISTSYGEYEFKNGQWTKTKEAFNFLTL